MADSKITALTALTAADPANDMIPIVDVSDTPPASGNTKRISINNLLACSPSATLASATITGDLTVRTNKLFVNATGVGVGTTSVFGDFTIQNGSNCRFEVTSSAGGTSIENLNNARNAYLNMTMYADAYIWNRLGTTAMTLNATGLGVGVSPLGKLHIRQSGAGIQEVGYFENNQAAAADVGARVSLLGTGSVSMATVESAWNGAASTDAYLSFRTRGSGAVVERLRIDSTGNVGIGVTPSAWDSGFQVIENSGGSLWSGSNGAVRLSQNAYYATSLKYKNALEASQYVQTSGQHQWYTAPSGTAGNAITFTQAMTLDASGNLLVGTTSTLAAWATKLVLSTNSGTTKWAVGPYADPNNFIISASGSFGVYLNGTSAVSWTGISDERLKDIIEPISNAVAKVGQLRSVIGKFKSDETNTRRSFLLAQDVQAVLPEAVDASNPDRLGVAYTDVIPLLVAAIKELTARVQTLETR